MADTNNNKILNVPNKREQNQTCLDSAEREGLRPKGNVPNLRFKEFQGEWEKKSLEEIGDSFIGLTYKPTDVVSEGGLIVFRSSNIQNGCIDYKDIVRVNKNVKEKLITKKDDLLVCARNGSARLIGKNAILHEADANQTFGAFMMVFRSDKNHFVHQLMNTRRYYSQVSENLGARINQITSSDLSSFEFFFPTENSEMNKIAALLDLLDERIATQNKIIDKLQSLIKGISNKLLNSKEGMLVRLGAILKERSEKTKKNNQYAVLSSTVNGLFSQRDYFSKDIASENNVGYKIIRLHDVVLSPQNLWMGNINYNDKFDIGIVSPSYKVFLISDDYDKRYVAAMLKTHRALYDYQLISAHPTNPVE